MHIHSNRCWQHSILVCALLIFMRWVGQLYDFAVMSRQRQGSQNLLILIESHLDIWWIVYLWVCLFTVEAAALNWNPSCKLSNPRLFTSYPNCRAQAVVNRQLKGFFFFFKNRGNKELHSLDSDIQSWWAHCVDEARPKVCVSVCVCVSLGQCMCVWMSEFLGMCSAYVLVSVSTCLWICESVHMCGVSLCVHLFTVYLFSLKPCLHSAPHRALIMGFVWPIRSTQAKGTKRFVCTAMRPGSGQ